jgi:DNA helicase-2/ATP-dependent DNA helicase PcrA
VAELLDEAGISEYHMEHDEVSGETRLANLQELVNGAALREAIPEGLGDFLEHIALDRAIDEEDEGPVITVQYENGRRQRFLSRAP